VPDIMKVYWSKIRSNEGIIAQWAELGHAMLRLKFVVSELELGMKNLKDLQSIYRVQCLLANYYAYIYEFQERLFSFISAMTRTSKKKVKEMLLKPNQEVTLLSVLPTNTKDCIVPLKQILGILADDIDIRNTQTHDTFIRLAFNEGLRWVDIEDVWWELEEDTVYMEKTFKLMRKQGSLLVKEYKLQTERIDRNLNVFLKKSLIPFFLPTYSGNEGDT